MKIKHFIAYAIVLGIVSLGIGCTGSDPKQDSTIKSEPPPPNPQSVPETPLPVSAAPPFDVLANFIPSGWMGDGQSGRKYLQFDDTWKNKAHTPPCVKIDYTLGPKKYAPIRWQNLPDNFGGSHGEDWSKKGYTRVTFWAKGNSGGESVEFIVGGTQDTNLPYKDSFRASTGKISLEKEWKKYTIDLKGQSLSCVIGGICFTTAPSSAITFYIDDVFYE